MKHKIGDDVLFGVALQRLGYTGRDAKNRFRADTLRQLQLNRSSVRDVVHQQHGSIKPDGTHHTSNRQRWDTPSCQYTATAGGRIMDVKLKPTKSPHGRKSPHPRPLRPLRPPTRPTPSTPVITYRRRKTIVREQ